MNIPNLRRQTVCMFLALLLPGSPAMSMADSSQKDKADLQAQIESIDRELETLARFSLRSGIGTIGYRSPTYPDAHHKPWVKIDFGQSYVLDEIILVPALWRDTEKGFLDDGFPIAFNIYGGQTSADTEGEVIASYRRQKNAPHGIAPVVIPLAGIKVSWIRLEATELSRRNYDKLHSLQFSEILAFSGHENVALHKAVSSVEKDPTSHVHTAWKAENLVDGFMPYLMDAAQGEQSNAYLSPIGIGETPFITIDLQKQTSISGIHLHSIDQSDTVPQASPPGMGIPDQYIIEGASSADFSDPQSLLEINSKTIYDLAPILMWRFPETTCRFVRLTAIEPYMYTNPVGSGTRIGFAEINILTKGLSVSTGKPILINFDHTDEHRLLNALTDGRNLYGNILPLRTWLNQLALRHQLETRRPILADALNLKYLKQKQLLQLMGWVIGGITLIAIALFFIDRLLRQQAIIQTRERIAADLHDELGANLHAIGLLSNLAQASKSVPEKSDKLLQEIRTLTERTGKAARYCSNMLEAKGLYGNLVNDMEKAASRMMPDRKHDITIEGEEFLTQLKGQKQIDLFLFYKECLANILRHSDATHVNTHLKATPKSICLTITENRNTVNSPQSEPPPSLVRRAKLLSGKLQLGYPEGKGPEIKLTLINRKTLFPH